MDPAVLRDDMVEGLAHESKGVVRSEAVSVAMREVPRHEFVADDRAAYADTPHECHGTRVLSPSTVARLLEALSVGADDSVLVEAAAVRPPRALVDQLAADGRLVMPLADGGQTLSILDADGEVVRREGTVAFQPLLVEGEQAGSVERNRTLREDRERARRAQRRRSGWEHDWIDWD